MTRTKDVNGMMSTVYRPIPIPTKVTVRITSDEHGETLSLSDDKAEIMLIIPIEPVNDLIKVVKE